MKVHKACKKLKTCKLRKKRRHLGSKGMEARKTHQYVRLVGM